MTAEYAQRRGWTVVDVTEDLDLSASTVLPFDRPGWRRGWPNRSAMSGTCWLFWRADRAVQPMTYMFALTRWAQQRRKAIVFVSVPLGGDPLTLDLQQDKADLPVNLILAIIAFAAEIESRATRERINAARAFLLPTDR